jgi:putative endonuclease
MSKRLQSIGKWGEELAADFLTRRGYRVIERNERTPYGEIDLVARMDDVLVFVEVKTRTSTRFGLPEEAVTAQKQEHMRSAAQDYLQRHPDMDGDWRCDVIAIRGMPGKEPVEVVHFENVVQ